MPKHRVTLVALTTSMTHAGAASTAAGGQAHGMRFVPDVEGQFLALAERPEALGLPALHLALANLRDLRHKRRHHVNQLGVPATDAARRFVVETVRSVPLRRGVES